MITRIQTMSSRFDAIRRGVGGATSGCCCCVGRDFVACCCCGCCLFTDKRGQDAKTFVSESRRIGLVKNSSMPAAMLSALSSCIEFAVCANSHDQRCSCTQSARDSRARR